MRLYKLKALSVSALGNRVLRKEDNEVYKENAWPEGRAEELVKAGFLVRVGKTKEAPKKVDTPKVEKKDTPKVEEPKTEKKEQGKTEKKEKTKEDIQEDIPTYDDVTVKQLKANLITKGTKFGPRDSKKILYKKLYGVDAK